MFIQSQPKENCASFDLIMTLNGYARHLGVNNLKSGVHFKLRQTATVKLFAKIVTGFQALAVLPKRSYQMLY